jgi:preprotein translocase subunit Sss1
MLLNRKPHIKEYEKLRKMHSEIMDSMMKYYQDGKFTPEADDGAVQAMANNVRKGDSLTLLNAEFDFDTRVGNQAFADMIVYKNTPDNNCITEEYIVSKRFRKPEKIEFLQSMLDSKIGLFSITGVDRGEGYAYLEEVFTGDKYKITDISMSGDPVYDRFYMYTRIITYRGISLNTGLSIAFSKNDPFIKDFIKRQKKNYNPAQEFVRFTELYNRFSNDAKSVKVVSR